MNSSLEHLHRATTDGKRYSTMELNYTDRYQVTVGRIGGATYPLWYSWHSQAWMQPSVPARPLFLLYISNVLLLLKKTQLQLNSGKHDMDMACLCFSTVTTGKLRYGIFCCMVRGAG